MRGSELYVDLIKGALSDKVMGASGTAFQKEDEEGRSEKMCHLEGEVKESARRNEWLCEGLLCV